MSYRLFLPSFPLTLNHLLNQAVGVSSLEKPVSPGPFDDVDQQTFCKVCDKQSNSHLVDGAPNAHRLQTAQTQCLLTGMFVTGRIGVGLCALSGGYCPMWCARCGACPVLHKVDVVERLLGMNVAMRRWLHTCGRWLRLGLEGVAAFNAVLVDRIRASPTIIN